MNEVTFENLTIEHVYATLLPWWDNSQTLSSLKTQTETSAEIHLNRFYLFPLAEMAINNNVEDVVAFVQQRYQTVLAAAYTAGISIATVIKGESGCLKFYVGFATESSKENQPEYFESIINGVLPGPKTKLEETTNLPSLLQNLPKGGIITGIPSLNREDKTQTFNISSVVRCMYGKEYVLAIMAKPVNREDMQQRLMNLLYFRDRCHELAKTTIGEEESSGQSTAINEQIMTGKSGIDSWKFNAIVVTRALKNLSESKTQGKTDTYSSQNMHSRSMEKQNGLALELEKIAEHFIQRIIQGFNTGYWETTITFAAKDQISCDILGGSFLGELAKPSDKLYPPRLYTSEIEEKGLFLPKSDSGNVIFPKSLASYITSEELAQIASPPAESLPGYEIKKMPALALTDVKNRGEIILGTITDYGNPIKDSFITLAKNDLNKHLFVCGLTGSGKTTTIKNILKSLQRESIPFLVVESAKRDYRQLLGDDSFKEKLHIFTIGDATVSPIRFNPFYIQEGVHPLVHIDYLKAIFNASFSLYGPMPHIIEKCLHNIYLKRGWNLTSGIHPHFLNDKNEYDAARYQQPEHHYCFPTLTDLKDEVDHYIKNDLEYKGELRDNIRTAIIARLESLCVGSKGLMFNTYDFYPLKELLSNNTILEMESLADDDDKAFFVGLILVLMSEYRQRDNPAVNPGRRKGGLQHFLVLEEAHRLLKNVQTERISEMMGNPKGKAVEVFCNVISEMRSFGQGVAVVEQIPTKIAPDVIKNSNTKIVHRLVARDDQSLLAGSLGMHDTDALYLTRLQTGHALCHKEGMERPVECVITDDVYTHAISDQKVYKIMKEQRIKTIHSSEVYELAALLKDSGKELVVRFFNSLCTNGKNVAELIEIVNREIHHLLLLKNSYISVNDKQIADYLTKTILELLVKGIFCRTPKFPRNLKEIFFHLLTTPHEKSYQTFSAAMISFWNVAELPFFIREVVESLSSKYLLQQRTNWTKENIENTVSSFYLVANGETVSAIVHEIIQKYGAKND